MKFNKVLSFGLALSLMFGISACKNNIDVIDKNNIDVTDKNNKDNIDEEKTANKWESAKVIGTVGDDKIYDGEFIFYFNMNKSQMEKDADLEGKSDEEKSKYWESENGNENNKQKLIDKTFDDLAKLKVLLRLAKQENVKLLENDVMQIERNIYSFIKEKANENQEEAEKLMKEMYGVSIEEYRWIYEDYYIAYYRYANFKTEKIEVSDKEIEERFERDKEKYKKVNIRNVLLYTIDVDTQEPLEEDKIKQKRQLAEDILKRVKDGESIEELAKQYSENPQLKITGGNETIGSGETVAEFENWVFNAKEGDIGLIETSYGIHVVKVIKKFDAALGEEEKSTIKKELQKEKFEEMIEKMKEKNPLVKNEEVLKTLDLF